MTIFINIDFEILSYILGYLLIGALGVLTYQATCQAKNRLNFLWCSLWIVFWLPILIISAALAAFGILVAS